MKEQSGGPWKITLGKGDLLVLRVDKLLSRNDTDSMMGIIEKLLPGIPVSIVGPDIEIGIIRVPK
jgi:hypothetical protein